MKKYILFPLLLLGILSSKCKKDPPTFKERPDVYYDFREEDTVKVTYHTGKETLRFIHTKDGIIDTVTYVGQGKTFDEYCLGIIYGNDYESEYAEFGKSYNIHFKADKPGMDMDFEVIAHDGDAELNIKLRNYEANHYLGLVNLPACPSYFSQKEVNGKIYYNVNTINTGDHPNTFNLAYTIQYGIIRMELFEKESWALIN